MTSLSGLETLATSGFTLIKNRRIGLVTNQSAILRDGKSAIEALRRDGSVKLVALFGPEHGVRGDVPAGKWVNSYKDKATGLLVYSLYGPTKVPTAPMLKGLEALVFDLQDIGSRSYTYLSTLGCVLEGAARHGLPVIVLDRPNPCGLTRIEGGPIRPGYSSFVGKYPLGYLHGLTLGEAAKAVGKSKTTLHRAIKSGRISATKSDDGSYAIDPSELHRVFPAVTLVTPNEVFLRNDTEHKGNTLETLRIQLEMQEKERERERALLQETIADLRDDRDKWRQQATALLGDHRPKGFFKRLLGR